MPTRLLACIRKEWLALRRDVHALVALFVMPAAFILIMSLALQDAFPASREARYDYVLVDRTTSATAREFATELNSTGGDRRVEGDLSALRAGRASYAIVLEADFGGDARAPGQAWVSVVGAPDLPETALALLEARIGDRLAHFRARSAAASGEAAAIAQQMGDGLVVRRYDVTANLRPTAVQQNVPAWLIFGMFFVVLPLSSMLISERTQGTLQRLRAMRVPAPLFLLGKLVPYFIVNMLQGVVMLAVGVFVVPLLGAEALHPGTSYGALAAVLAAVSVAALGYALLVANLARTTEQANIVGGLGNVLLGAIGGIMVPKIVMPHEVQRWTDASPMAWGHEAMLRLFLRGGGIGEVLIPIAALCGFGLACAALAWFVFQRRSAA